MDRRFLLFVGVLSRRLPFASSGLLFLVAGCSLLYSGSDYNDGSPLLPGLGSSGGADAQGPPVTGNPVGPADAALEDAAAQATFLSVHGGPAPDQHHAATVLADGSVVVVGTTNSIGAGDRDATFMILGRDGTIKSSRVFGGVGNDQFYSIVPRTGGGFYAVGLTRSDALFATKKEEGLIVRFGPDGTIIWAKNFGGSATDEILFGAAPTADGGLVAAGRISTTDGLTDAWLVRFTDAGVVTWDRAIGGPAADEFSSVSTTPDGKIVAVGKTASFGAGNMDAFVVEVDANGGPVAARAVGGANEDRASAVRAEGSSIVVAGTTYSFGRGLGDGWILSLDARLDVGWSRTVGSEGPDSFAGLTVTSDRIYGHGQTLITSGGQDVGLLTVALDRREGTPLWTRRFGGDTTAGPMTTAFSSITQAEDGSLVLLGAQGQPTNAVALRITSTGELRGECAAALVDPKAAVTVNEVPVTLISSQPISPTISSPTSLAGNVTLGSAPGLAEAPRLCASP